MPTFAHYLRALGYRTVLTGKMHFIGPDQLHGFEERPLPDVYPAGLDWIPDWRLADDETLPWYHDLSSVLRAGPVRGTLQTRYDAAVAEPRAVQSSRARATRIAPSSSSSRSPTHTTRTKCRPSSGTGTRGVEIDAPLYPNPPAPIDAPTSRLRAMVAADRIAVSAEQALLARRGYYGTVSLVDDHVGAILATLEEQGLAETPS